MLFAHDTELALAETVALINTRDEAADTDMLQSAADFATFLRRNPYSGTILGTPAELESVRALRPRLRELWSVPDRDHAAAVVNQMLAETDARPYLAKHDTWDWHLHLTSGEAPLAHRITAEAAMAFLELIRTDELDRLRSCAGETCTNVLVDLSRNRSKRYCDDGNCGNRAHVAAYRARKRGRG